MFSTLSILSFDQGKLYGDDLSEDDFYRRFAPDLSSRAGAFRLHHRDSKLLQDQQRSADPDPIPH